MCVTADMHKAGVYPAFRNPMHAHAVTGSRLIEGVRNRAAPPQSPPPGLFNSISPILSLTGYSTGRHYTDGPPRMHSR